MADQPENRFVDKRVAHRYVRKGIVEEKDYDRYLKSLADLSELAAPVEASIEAEDLDLVDEDEGGEGGAES